MKRRPSHRKRQDSQKVHRHGSVLSDYTKPVVVKRKKEGATEGATSSEESDTADQPDGTRVPSVRVSGDGGSNEDAGKQPIIDARANWHLGGSCFGTLYASKGFFLLFFRCLSIKGGRDRVNMGC